MSSTQFWLYQDEGYPLLLILENGYFYRYLINGQNIHFLEIQNHSYDELEAYSEPNHELLIKVEHILINEAENRLYIAFEHGLKTG